MMVSRWAIRDNRFLHFFLTLWSIGALKNTALSVVGFDVSYNKVVFFETDIRVGHGIVDRSLDV